eukprot:2044363-Pyramimonas_sp.AAC.1
MVGIVIEQDDVPLVGDIADLAEDDVPPHDLLTAGFCCQSFSKAGKQGGFEDARGELFFEVVRTLTKLYTVYSAPYALQCTRGRTHSFEDYIL